MGKISLDFDHITDKKEINELSVVLYAGSFFYGLWGADNYLLKTGYHPLYNLASVSSIWDYYYDFSSVNVMSAQLPFSHVPSEMFESAHFELYFQGLYNLDRVLDKTKKAESFDNQNITTLHYLESKASDLMKGLNSNFQAAHISTAMANHIAGTDSELICHLANDKLHITVQDKNGFRFYNQYSCNYQSDYLYYLILVFEKFGFDRNLNTLKIGGSLDDQGLLYKSIRKHFHLIELLPQTIQFRKPQFSANNYCDLYLCKSCV